MSKNDPVASRPCLLLFTRFPETGRVKTRLAPFLGQQGAAEIHARLTETVLNNIAPFLACGQLHLEIFFAGGTADKMSNWLGRDYGYVRQQGNGLGERMAHAFAWARHRQHDPILLIGSDCPAVDPAILSLGLHELQGHDLVLGPTVDGGYYLIGLQAAANFRPLFSGIDWGTDQVLAQTLARAAQNGLSRSLLPKLHDIDRPEDLVHFNYHTHA